LTGAIDLLVAVVLFVPIWKGETLAPTHLTFLFIPVRWVLILVGGLIVPLVGAAAAHGALALLRRGEYVLAGRLPPVGEKEARQKHWAEITLW